MDNLERIWERVKRLFEVEIEKERERTQVQTRLKTRSTIERQQDGGYRLISVSAVSAINRVGEIDARNLFDSFIEDWKNGAEVQRDFMHFGDLGDPFITGDVDFMARDGNVLVTSTLYRDTPLANGEVQSRLEHPEYWGDSIAYSILGEPEHASVDDADVLVFNEGRLRFVSTVPEKLAASHFTMGNLEGQQEVGRMWNDLDQTTKDAFVKLLGDEGKAQEHWENVDSVNRQIEEEELVTRAQETETEEQVAETEPDPEPGIEYVETTVELDDEAVGEVARRVAEADSITALFAPLMERISQLEDSVQALSEELKERDKTEEVMRQKVAELERDENEKFIEMIDDFPRRNRITVTHRPSENTNDEVDVSLKEKADTALESWGNDKFYNS